MLAAKMIFDIFVPFYGSALDWPAALTVNTLIALMRIFTDRNIRDDP